MKAIKIIKQAEKLQLEIKELEDFMETCRYSTGDYNTNHFCYNVKITKEYRVLGFVKYPNVFTKTSSIKIPESIILDVAAKVNLILADKREELNKLLNIEDNETDND
jgi:hypothetical protein